jgi:glyoxalase family protein
VTSFSVPTGAFDFWRTRLGAQAVALTDVEPRFGEPAIRFSDRSGLVFELVATDRDARAPWVPPDAGDEMSGAAIRGLHSVTIVVREPEKTIELMTGLLGYTVIDRAAQRTRLGVAGGGPGKIVDVAHRRDAETAMNGIGTVHHVAMAVDSDTEQLHLREELIRYGCKVTDVRDRCYFQSIYFREPGGTLFEIATVQPGFTADEDVAALGSALKLPPWEEPNRALIEAALVPVTTRS